MKPPTPHLRIGIGAHAITMIHSIQDEILKHAPKCQFEVSESYLRIYTPPSGYMTLMSMKTIVVGDLSFRLRIGVPIYRLIPITKKLKLYVCLWAQHHLPMDASSFIDVEWNTDPPQCVVWVNRFTDYQNDIKSLHMKLAALHTQLYHWSAHVEVPFIPPAEEVHALLPRDMDLYYSQITSNLFYNTRIEMVSTHHDGRSFSHVFEQIRNHYHWQLVWLPPTCISGTYRLFH